LFRSPLDELQQAGPLLLHLLFVQATSLLVVEKDVLRVGRIARRSAADGRPVDRRLLVFLADELMLLTLFIVCDLVPNATSGGAMLHLLSREVYRCDGLA